MQASMLSPPVVIAGVALLVTLIALLVTLGVYLRTRAVPMPSSRPVRAAVAAEVARAVAARARDATCGRAIHTIVDLGSGWGGLARDVAVRFPDLTVLGIELSPLPHLVARLRRSVAGPANLHHRRIDFRTLEPAPGTVYVCFLSPEAMREVRALLGNAAETGCVVVSALFAVRGWTPIRTAVAGDVYRTEVFVYEP